VSIPCSSGNFSFKGHQSQMDYLIDCLQKKAWGASINTAEIRNFQLIAFSELEVRSYSKWLQNVIAHI
jgi:hypothetical protein